MEDISKTKYIVISSKNIPGRENKYSVYKRSIVKKDTASTL